MLTSYTWIVVMGALGAFGFGWGTGANDVGNAFGTSVGAKTLTMLQATIIAAIFEFGGAMILGRVSTATIAGGIANVKTFQDAPMAYAYGMMWNLIVGGLWQGVACYYGWNVSATHSIIGGIIGFAWAFKGAKAVNWITHDPTVFPPYKGIMPIVLSWFIAPVLSAIAAATIFGLCRYLVLRHGDAQRRAIFVAPPLVLLTAFINIYFVFTKGAKKTIQQNIPKWTDNTSAWVAFLIAFVLALATWAAVPYMRRKIEEKERRRSEEVELAKAQQSNSVSGLDSVSRASSGGGLSVDAAEATDAEADAEAGYTKLPEPAGGNDDGGVTSDSSMDGRRESSRRPKSSSEHESSGGKSWSEMAKKAIMHGVSVDIHEIVNTDPTVHAIHSTAETFDPKAEAIFAYLQVFSAICVMFAHGAGEVGYMAGPLATIYDVYKTEEMSKKIAAPIWVVFISAFSLVVGLATYGYNITRAMGTQMVCLTPSRGFAAELSTALVILVSSQWGLPNSSSQCIVGGIVGVGMLEGTAGVNWKFMGTTFASWMVTLLITGSGTALLFAQGVYAPCPDYAK